MEAIRQTIIELRALNSVKEPPQLVGAETLRILTANQVDVLKIIKEFKPEMSNRKYHQQLTSQLGFGKSNKNNSFNPFSIENLLAGSKHGVVNSLGGQVNNMFGNVGALAGLSVGALSHYANSGQFSEAFNGMQAINNGAFVSAAAALANAQLNSGDQFAKRALKDGYELSDMEDDDSSSAGSYMSDEMLDVMMDDDMGTIKANEKLTLQLKNDQDSLVDNSSADKRLADEKEQALKAADQAAVLHSLAMNLSRKEQPPIVPEPDSCSVESDKDSDRKDKLKKPKKKDDNLSPRKRVNRPDDEETDNKSREDENCPAEPNENSSKETNQVQSNSHPTKKRILSELNEAEKPAKLAIKDESTDNPLAGSQVLPSPTDEQTEQMNAGSSSAS